MKKEIVDVSRLIYSEEAQQALQEVRTCFTNRGIVIVVCWVGFAL